MNSKQLTNGRRAALALDAINPWAHSCALWTTRTWLWKTTPLAGPARGGADAGAPTNSMARVPFRPGQGGAARRTE
jgi:hypothetical protein